MLKSVNNQQISTKRPQTTVTRHSLKHMGVFCLSRVWFVYIVTSTLKINIVWKVYVLWWSLTHCHIPCRGSHHRPKKNTIHEILAGVLNGFPRFGLHRRQRTQPFEVTSVGFGTERLTLFDHIISSSHLVRPWVFWRFVCAVEACSWFWLEPASSSSRPISDAAAYGSWAQFVVSHSFFLSWVSKTQPNHWTKWMASTRLAI